MLLNIYYIPISIKLYSFNSFCKIAIVGGHKPWKMISAVDLNILQ